MKWLDNLHKECVPEVNKNNGASSVDIDIDAVAKKVVELLSKGGQNDTGGIDEPPTGEPTGEPFINEPVDE